MRFHSYLLTGLFALSTTLCMAGQPSPGNYVASKDVVSLKDGQVLGRYIDSNTILKNIRLSSEETDESKAGVPGLVNNIQTLVTNEGGTVTVTWEPPTQDAEGNQLDASTLTYVVMRSIDGSVFDLMQQGITEMQYVDDSVKKLLEQYGLQQESIYYAVAAVNAEGVNGDATAETAVVGTPYKLPFNESFGGGYVSNNPWTVMHVNGSAFGWASMNNDEAAGMYAQDYDDGFIKFYSPYYEEGIDSRILSPMISLEGSENPVICFYMYHWADADITDDGKNTKFMIEVTEDSKTFTQVGETFMATAEAAGWYEHKVSLEAYKDCKQLRIALRGNMECNWMYYYIDNIHIEEMAQKDLCVLDLSGPDNIKMNAGGTYEFSYFNRGTESVSGYQLALYSGDAKLVSVDGEEIAPGESKYVELEYVPTAFDAGSECDIYAKIEIEDDYADNNISYNSIHTSIDGTWYPQASSLTAIAGEGNITLNWQVPEIPTDPVVTEEGVEDYEPFIISGIGDWTLYDIDQREAGAPYEFPAFPNKNTRQSFQVWNPYELDMELTEEDAWLLPRTGNQCFICWYAMTSYGDTPYNDDWLISPELLGSTTFSFWMRRLRTSENETYQILQSTTDTEIESFTLVKEGIATADWEYHEIEVGEDVKYIAIRYTGQDQYGLMIDDISYTSAIYGLKVLGYNIFRDGVKLNEEPLTDNTYVDEAVEDGQTYTYTVSVVYNNGESVDTDEVSITYTEMSGIEDVENHEAKIYAVEGGIVVDSEGGENVTVYNIGGTLIKAFECSGKHVVNVGKGAYIVKTGNAVTKVLVP